LIKPDNSGCFLIKNFFNSSRFFLISLASPSAETAIALLISEDRFFLLSIRIEIQGLFNKLKNFVESFLVAK
jgi:hypothetical protein